MQWFCYGKVLTSESMEKAKKGNIISSYYAPWIWTNHTYFPSFVCGWSEIQRQSIIWREPSHKSTEDGKCVVRYDVSIAMTAMHMWKLKLDGLFFIYVELFRSEQLRLWVRVQVIHYLLVICRRVTVAAGSSRRLNNLESRLSIWCWQCRLSSLLRAAGETFQ